MTRDEVWDGVLVLLPFVDNDHQSIKMILTFALNECVTKGAYMGVNVSDRNEDWLSNFRCPDACVFLPENPAINHHSHYEGGPDFLAEVLSPNELPYEKLPFYASVGTREVLIIDRDPWSLELHRLKRKKLVLVGRSDEQSREVLASRVVPLTFQLVNGEKRQEIEITHMPSGKTWNA